MYKYREYLRCCVHQIVRRSSTYSGYKLLLKKRPLISLDKRWSQLYYYPWPWECWPESLDSGFTVHRLPECIIGRVPRSTRPVCYFPPKMQRAKCQWIYNSLASRRLECKFPSRTIHSAVTSSVFYSTIIGQPTFPFCTMSTMNMVKYYFYKGKMPKDPKELRDMVALAYQTARDMKLHPRAILIRWDWF